MPYHRWLSCFCCCYTVLLFCQTSFQVMLGSLELHQNNSRRRIFRDCCSCHPTNSVKECCCTLYITQERTVWLHNSYFKKSNAESILVTYARILFGRPIFRNPTTRKVSYEYLWRTLQQDFFYNPDALPCSQTITSKH